MLQKVSKVLTSSWLFEGIGGPTAEWHPQAVASCCLHILEAASANMKMTLSFYIRIIYLQFGQLPLVVCLFLVLEEDPE